MRKYIMSYKNWLRKYASLIIYLILLAGVLIVVLTSFRDSPTEKSLKIEATTTTIPTTTSTTTTTTTTLPPATIPPTTRVTTTTSTTVAPVVQSYSEDKQQWMASAGIPEDQWWAVDFIIFRESKWLHTAVNSYSGATGLCQSLPASKMATAGADYLTNPITQLKWCHSYALQRYGGWVGAVNFWKNNHWW